MCKTMCNQHPGEGIITYHIHGSKNGYFQKLNTSAKPLVECLFNISCLNYEIKKHFFKSRQDTAERQTSTNLKPFLALARLGSGPHSQLFITLLPSRLIVFVGTFIAPIENRESLQEKHLCTRLNEADKEPCFSVDSLAVCDLELAIGASVVLIFWLIKIESSKSRS